MIMDIGNDDENTLDFFDDDNEDSGAIPFLGCGYFVDGKRWLVYRETIKGKGPRVIILNSDGFLTHAIERDGDRYTFKGGIVVDNLAIPKFLSWSKASMAAFLRGKAEEHSLKFLADSVEGILRNAVYLEEQRDYRLLTYWIISSYFAGQFKASPGLLLNAEAESGKTTAARNIITLSFQGASSKGQKMVKGKSSQASLWRLLHKQGYAAVVLDDLEAIGKKEMGGDSEFLKGLLTSYEKDTANAELVISGEEKELKTFGWKIFTAINEASGALATRLIKLPLKKKPAGWEVYEPSNVEAAKIRDMLHTYSMHPNNIELVDRAREASMHGAPLNSRDLEITIPLRSIAYLLGEREALDERLVELFARPVPTEKHLIDQVKEVALNLIREGFKTISIVQIEHELMKKGLETSSRALGGAIYAAKHLKPDGLTTYIRHRYRKYVPSDTGLETAQKTKRSLRRSCREYCPQADNEKLDLRVCKSAGESREPCPKNGKCPLQRV